MEGAFSKLSGLKFEDEEDERQGIWEKARDKFLNAERTYAAKGSSQEALKAFEHAEDLMAPLLANGFAGLKDRELEALLKGRLHRAALCAQLIDLPDRWKLVKKLAEDVLQFDFNNCHAHWLRGLALAHGMGARSEAKTEMERAVECAKNSGKTAEVKQWEEEIKRNLEEGVFDDSLPEATPQPADAQPGASESELQRQPLSKASSSSRNSGKDTKTGGLKAGFLTAKTPGRTASRSPAPARPSSGAQASSSSMPSPSSVRERELETELNRLRSSHKDNTSEVENQIQLLQQRLESEERMQDRWTLELRQQMESIGALSAEISGSVQFVLQSPSSDVDIVMGLAKQVEELRSNLESDKKWTETAHSKLMDVSTEMDTLRNMTFGESRERQEVSTQNMKEVRELTSRFQELKASIKGLREGLRLRLPDISRSEEMEKPRIAEGIADFKSLAPNAKLWVLLDDASFLRLLFLIFIFGMLLALGIFVEFFSSRRCHFVCAS